MIPAKAIASLLNPQSIAIIGISPRARTGTTFLENTLMVGYKKPIYLVNPNYPDINGRKCYPSLKELPEVPDKLIVALPADAVLPVLEDAYNVGIRSALVVAEGFADANTDEGRARQAKLRAFAFEKGMAVSGPNCMGISSLCHGFANSFGEIPEGTQAGGISVVSQSGGLLNAVTELGNNRNFGLNYLISGGNEAVVETADYIDYLVEDPHTKVICCILEGPKNGRRFRESVERATRKKPVIILKLGRSKYAQKSTLAHTGSLAGSYETFMALFQQNGVTSVESLDELLETASLFTHVPLPKGDRVAIFMVSGGATSLLGDRGDAAGVNFPELNPETNKKLQAIIEVDRAFNNPMDTIGMPRLAKGDNLARVVQTMIDDPDIDVIGFVLGMRLYPSAFHKKMAQTLSDIAKTTHKPILIVSFQGNSLTQYWRTAPETAGLGIVEDADGGMKAVAKLTQYAVFRNRVAAEGNKAPAAATKQLKIDVGGAKRTSLTEFESKKILGDFGLPVTGETLATSAEEAAKASAKIGFPVAMKIQSPDVMHKSDAGGVVLGVKSAEEAKAAYETILKNVAKHHPKAQIDGVLIQEMVGKGTEMILGMNNDEVLGPVIVCGLGGIFVEVMKDTALRFPPLSEREARDMLSGLKSMKLLEGYRGAPAGDIDALVKCLMQFSDFVAQTDGQFAAIDINPVIVLPKGKGVRIADALIIPQS
jgi:acyl-CoA synthetase (NDP forming)